VVRLAAGAGVVAGVVPGWVVLGWVASAGGAVGVEMDSSLAAGLESDEDEVAWG
jgi:hypothetical protein